MAAVEGAQPVVPVPELNEKLNGLGLDDQQESQGTMTQKDTMGKTSTPSTSVKDEEATSNILKTPFVHPLPTSRPVAQAPLTSAQKTHYTTVLSNVQSWTTIPTTSAKNSPTTPLTDPERMWLTDAQLLRYLRATKWNPSDATTRLLNTLIWRREYGIPTFTPDHISPENETGKQVILGYDNQARPCLYMSPSRQNTPRSDRQIQHLVFMLERLIDLMPPGQESWTFLMDFASSSSSSNASFAQAKQSAMIFQNHYPERLGRALAVNIPWFISTFFKLILPVLDPLTRTKLQLNAAPNTHIPAAQLTRVAGGEVEFVYEHEVYWPALNALAAERRSELETRWISGGKMVGESEDWLKGMEGAMSLSQRESESKGDAVDGE